MKKISSSVALPLLECINPVRNKWRVRAFVSEQEDQYEYVEKEFIGKPSMEQIKECVLDWHNSEIDKIILTGFVWNDMPVWLSTENQFNYKASYDLAVQTGGKSLPVECKFGSAEKPLYHNFTTLDEFTEFYMSIVMYVQGCLKEGWAVKDGIDWEEYDG